MDSLLYLLFNDFLDLGPDSLDDGVAVELLADLVGGDQATVGDELLQMMGEPVGAV